MDNKDSSCEHEPVAFAASAGTSPYPRESYAWYVVGILTIAYAFSLIDRQIISLMITPIKQDIGLTDIQIGLLGGTAFALFYTCFGIPLGYLADTRSRRTLIAVGFLGWSMMTFGSGFASTLWHLLVFRIGVAVGEATLSPAAYSLISDYFPPRRRATAIGVYSLGIYMGSGLAAVCLGQVIGFTYGRTDIELPWIGTVAPWQLVFFIVGLLGVPFALLLYTVREVERRTNGKTDAAAAQPSLREVLACMNSTRKIFVCIYLGAAAISMANYANGTWMFQLFERRFGWTIPYTGTVIGTIIAVCGTLGVVAGGRLADWLSERGHADANLRVALLGTILSLPFIVLYPLMPSGMLAAAMLIPSLLCGCMWSGVVAASIQQLMPNAMRARASALYLFVLNLIGMGLGPYVVGQLSQTLFPDGQGLHYALVIVLATGNTVGLVLFWMGLKPYRRIVKGLAFG